MKIIGITGGIGSGKSTVANILQNFGAKVIDADRISREVTEKGQPALKEIVDYFGEEVLNKDGDLDRKKLGEIVFKDDEKLKILNDITHKYIIERIRQHLDKFKAENVRVVVLDVPLPVKHGFLDIVDEVWVVVAKKETRVKRIIERNGFSYKEAISRINAQQSDEDYLKIADEVIQNDGTTEDLVKYVTMLYNKKTL